jgi:hypothetical protein
LNSQKTTDRRQKWTFLQPQFFLILRRNEAERKHSAKKLPTLQYFSPPIHSACTLPKGLPTSQSQKRTTTHLIPPYLKSKETTLFFLSFCIFLLLFQRSRNRASTGLGLRANFCTLFLVRTCLKLPSPGHALRICLRHHFWTGLARLFRTIGI